MNIKCPTLLFLAALYLPFVAAASIEPLTEPGVDVTDAGQKQPLFLTLFIHDQISPADRAGLGPDYLEWFSKELSHITGRRVSFKIITDKPGYTDFGYRLGNHGKAIDEWRERTIDYITDNNLPLRSKRHKYILVTKNNITSDVLGVAAVNAGAAIASLKSYSTIGHEIGHLFAASHENSETNFPSGIPCRTLMYPSQTEFFPSCYAFSEKNRNAIRQYLNDTP